MLLLSHILKMEDICEQQGGIGFFLLVSWKFTKQEGYKWKIYY